MKKKDRKPQLSPERIYQYLDNRGKRLAQAIRANPTKDSAMKLEAFLKLSDAYQQLEEAERKNLITDYLATP